MQSGCTNVSGYKKSYIIVARRARLIPRSDSSEGLLHANLDPITAADR
jgi:hypothetical protein